MLFRLEELPFKVFVCRGGREAVFCGIISSHKSYWSDILRKIYIMAVI